MANKERNREEANLLFSNEQILNSEFFKDVLHLRFTADLLSEKELIGIDIPIENRISYLLPYSAESETVTSTLVAHRLEVDLGWVNRTAQNIGITPLSEQDWGSQVEYPYVTLPLLETELIWQQGYAELPDFLSANAIVDFMGTSKSWVKETAQELGVTPIVMKSKNNHDYQAYPKKLIPMLRHVFLSIPAQAEWDSSLTFSQMTGTQRRWIERQLAARGVLPRRRRSNNNYRVANFYAPGVFENHVIKIIENRPKPAGDWLTEAGMAILLEKSQDWVRTQNTPNRYNGEIRLTSAMVPAFHYPPEVYRILKRHKQILDAIPRADDKIALKSLAKAVGHSRAWTRRRLPYVQARVTQRINNAQHIHDYFDSDLVEQLTSLPADILDTSSLSSKEDEE